MRTFNETMRGEIQARIRTIVEHIARSAGAHGEVFFDNPYPVTCKRRVADRAGAADAQARGGGA